MATGTMTILGAPASEKTVTWNTDNPESVVLAMQRFDEEKLAGSLTTAVDETGNPVKIDEFNPEQEKVLIARQMQGGTSA